MLRHKFNVLHPVVFAVVGRAASLSESDTVLAFTQLLTSYLVP